MLGPISLARLATCDPRLQALFKRVDEYVPCAILVGRRGKADQDAAVAAGKSKTPWPTSKHNAEPPALARAADAAPTPIDWADTPRWVMFGLLVVGVAFGMGIRIRWGGAWAGGLTRNGKGQLDDLDHFELLD